MKTFSERWDFPQDYVDRVGQAAKTNDMQTVMALHQEGFEHGDLLAYTFAFRKFLMQEAVKRVKEAPERSLTWDEAQRDVLFEPILYPELLWLCHEYDVLKDNDEYTSALVESWVQPEWPEQYLDTSIWCEYFADAGFVIDAEGEGPMEPPTEPVVLWRGAAESRKTGMSWTGRPEVANWFAKRFHKLEEAEPVKVFRLVAPPDVLMAHFTGRNEDEWVVDPYFLEDDESAVIEEFEIDSLPEFAKPRQTASVSADQEEGE